MGTVVMDVDHTRNDDFSPGVYHLVVSLGLHQAAAQRGNDIALDQHIRPPVLLPLLIHG